MGELVIWMRVKLGKGFWVGEVVIWLRMMVGGAWEMVLGG
jgi:hypothetical protein